MVFDEGCTFQFPSLKIHFGKMLMNEVWHHFKSARVDMFITFVSFIPSCSTIESLSRGTYVHIYDLVVSTIYIWSNCCQAAKYFEGSFHLFQNKKGEMKNCTKYRKTSAANNDCSSLLSCSKNQMTKKCKSVQSSRPDSHFKIKFFKKYLTCCLDCRVLEFFVLWLT